MAKGKKSVFFCQNCGHEENKWLGQCPMCKEWNTFVEEPVSFSKSASAKLIKDAEVVALKHVETDQEERIKTKIEELDRVLGGGIVPGSLLLVGGDPGIGKSTLLLQVCQRLCEDKHQVLYISGEESLKQIKLRANRMGEFTEDLLLLCETNLEIVKNVIQKRKPEVVIIDSIQTMYSEEVASAPGSVPQVRESTNVFMQYDYAFAIHETKTGTVIEHVKDFISEIGILYMSDFNRKILMKLIHESELEFIPLFDCNTYVYVWKKNPIASKSSVSLQELEKYPCLTFDQGKTNSFYFAEEVFSTYEYKQTIQVDDRASMLNLMVGLNGYTLCSGIICEELNGSDYAAVPLKETEVMTIGYVKRKSIQLSELAQLYVNELAKYKKLVLK